MTLNPGEALTSRPDATGQQTHARIQSASEIRKISKANPEPLTRLKSGAQSAYRAAKARPRLIAGLTLLGGAVVAALVFRRRLPGAIGKLSAAAAGMAIVSGAPEALDRLRSAADRARRSPMVTRSLQAISDAPDRLARSRPLRSAVKSARRRLG